MNCAICLTIRISIYLKSTILYQLIVKEVNDMRYLSFKRKWIKGECRHFCCLCKFKEECLKCLLEEEKNKIKFERDSVDRFNNKRGAKHD